MAELEILASLSGNGGPTEGGLVADAEGDLFGTTQAGGASTGGAVFVVLKNPTRLVGSAADPYADIDQDEGVYGGTSTDPKTQSDLSALQASLKADNLTIPNIVTGVRNQNINTTPTSTQNGILQADSSFTNAATINNQVISLENDAQAAANVPSHEQSDMDSLLDDMNDDGLSLESVFQSLASGGVPLTKMNINNQITSSTSSNDNAEYIRNDISYLNNDVGTDRPVRVAEAAAAQNTTPVTLASFGGSNGAAPEGGLITDASGDLFGTTTGGGAAGDGTVFELSKTVPENSPTPTTLASFAGAAGGSTPKGPLVADASGDLFGTTSAGGTAGDGTVFEITNSTGYSDTPAILASFHGPDGATPETGLIMDSAGDLFGTTSGGGTSGAGTVFEIAKTALGYSPTPATLVSFGGTAGAQPEGGLVMDSAGDLFGTTLGGGASGDGTVFEIAKTAVGYNLTPTTLVSFDGGTDGSAPEGGLIVDAAGNLFGMTAGGGASGDGTVFEIADTTAGYATTATTIASFDSSDSNTGLAPEERLIADPSGNLYGTTLSDAAQGGTSVVFEVTDSGFVMCFASGTSIRTTHGDVLVERLQVGDLVVTISGAPRPIRWLGHRIIDCRGHRTPHDVLPVRISANAFGIGLPMRDLTLSPGHPVLVGADEDGAGGHLVPIMCLVNGTTVRRVAVDTVTYWHVELDAHDILLAEGLPAESYLDWGDRAFFTEGSDHALQNPDFVVPGLGARCRPVAIDGPVLEAARRNLDMAFAMRLAAPCAWPEADAINL